MKSLEEPSPSEPEEDEYVETKSGVSIFSDRVDAERIFRHKVLRKTRTQPLASNTHTQRYNAGTQVCLVSPASQIYKEINFSTENVATVEKSQGGICLVSMEKDDGSIWFAILEEHGLQAIN